VAIDLQGDPRIRFAVWHIARGYSLEDTAERIRRRWPETTAVQARQVIGLAIEGMEVATEIGTVWGKESDDEPVSG